MVFTSKLIYCILKCDGTRGGGEMRGRRKSRRRGGGERGEGG